MGVSEMVIVGWGDYPSSSVKMGEWKELFEILKLHTKDYYYLIGRGREQLMEGINKEYNGLVSRGN